MRIWVAAILAALFTYGQAGCAQASLVKKVETKAAITTEQFDPTRIIPGHTWKQVDIKACSSSGECKSIGYPTQLVRFDSNLTMDAEPFAVDDPVSATYVISGKLLEITNKSQGGDEVLQTMKIEDLTERSFTLLEFNRHQTDASMYRYEYQRED